MSRLEFECSQVYSRPAVVSISAERPRAAGISGLGLQLYLPMEVSIDGERTLFHFFISETKRDFD